MIAGFEVVGTGLGVVGGVCSGVIRFGFGGGADFGTGMYAG